MENEAACAACRLHTVDGCLIIPLLMPMILISIILMLVMCFQSMETASQIKFQKVSLLDPPHQPKPFELASASSEIWDLPTYSEPSIFLNGNDVPFHVVRQLSRDMSSATRNYLERTEKILSTSKSLEIFD